MVQFQVPQFLDVEDKVIGPLTTKQFLYLLGGFGGGYILWKIIPWKFISIFPAIAMIVFAFMLAFYRYNNKPLVYVIEASFNYIIRDRLYVWRRREKKLDLEVDLSNFKSTRKGVGGPLGGTGKLQNLAFEIDAQSNTIEAQKASRGGMLQG
jgi:hypothetical protein